MTQPIARFAGDYRFLSNFYPALVEFDGDTYPSVEHAYQAAKTMHLLDRKKIRLIKRPGDAKQYGKTVTLRPNWDEIRLGIMLGLLRQKFSQGGLREWLLETGDAELIEGNNWGDFYWGVCAGTGHNFLGKLLMQVREEIRKNA